MQIKAEFVSDYPGFWWMLSFQRKGARSQHIHNQLQPPHPQDPGDSSKSSIVVTRNDKDTEAEEDRELGKKTKKQ